MKRNLVFGMVFVNILTGGGNVVQAAQPLVKTNAVTEVSGVTAAATQVPVTDPLVAGAFDYETQRVFDLAVIGNCKTGSSDSKISFNFKGAEAIPELFALDGGKLVFADVSPAATFTMPKGYNAQMEIILGSVKDRLDESGKTDETAKRAHDYLCLGISKNDAHVTELYIAGDGGNASALFDMEGGDVLKLTPLISSTKLSGGYTKASANAEIPSDFISAGGTIDFSAVYRINVNLSDPDVPKEVNWGDDEWGYLTPQQCKLTGIDTLGENYGHMGVGPVNGSWQMLSVNGDGKLATSSDGINWTSAGSILSGEETTNGWGTGPVWGNNQWWIVGNNGVKYSYDDGKTWEDGDTSIQGAAAVNFGGGMFMVIKKESIASETAYETWTLTNFDRVPNPKWEKKSGNSIPNMYTSNLTYHGGKWLSIGNGNNVYEYDTKNPNTGWQKIAENVPNSGWGSGWCGGFYAHGHYHLAAQFYYISSSDKTDWGERKALTSGSDWIYNITLYNDKLYILIGSDKTNKCIIGEFV